MQYGDAEVEPRTLHNLSIRHDYLVGGEVEPRLVRHAEVIPVEAVPGICRRTLAWGERAMVLESTFEAGAELQAHSHPHEQITYVVSGELEIRLGDEAHILCPGDSLFVPGGVRHAAAARTESVAVDAFSPPREDLK